ncbi:unnamed protein product [Vicia faba]|uniref:Uncharacterized protein n=1 Tax=Vicia faba TaxID=3906 RepID=A0AAV0YK40_VICFA|nr:unnamed protein product [Vicia faba]
MFSPLKCVITRFSSTEYALELPSLQCYFREQSLIRVLPSAVSLFQFLLLSSEMHIGGFDTTFYLPSVTSTFREILVQWLLVLPGLRLSSVRLVLDPMDIGRVDTRYLFSIPWRLDNVLIVLVQKGTVTIWSRPVDTASSRHRQFPEELSLSLSSPHRYRRDILHSFFDSTSRQHLLQTFHLFNLVL